MLRRQSGKAGGQAGNKGSEQGRKTEGGQPLSKELEQNIQMIRDMFYESSDLRIKEVPLGGRNAPQLAVLHIATLTDVDIVHRDVISPIVVWARPQQLGPLRHRDLVEELKRRVLTAQTVKTVETDTELADHLLEGNTVILIDSHSSALSVESRGWPGRGIQEPSVEITTRGPRLAFTETIKDNVALLRRRIKDPALTIEQLHVGDRSKTDVRLCYLRDLAPKRLVDELRRRVKAVQTDMILDSGQLENLIRDHPLSLFTTMRSTERPDSVASELNDGRIALLLDGTPFALVAPSTFSALFVSAEDHYVGFPAASVLRAIRFVGFGFSVALTPFYVAMTTFHQELLPLPLLLNVAATQTGVPFPVVISALIAEVVIEVLREAGVRLPQQFGPAVSIVGALVLGQAAVQAGFVPPGLVIVVTIAAIASFSVPRTEVVISFRLIRVALLVMASILGFMGLVLGTVLTVYHLGSLKSLGMPYLALYTPGRVSYLAEEYVLTPQRIKRPVRPTAVRNRVRAGPPPELLDPTSGPHRKGSKP